MTRRTHKHKRIGALALGLSMATALAVGSAQAAGTPGGPNSLLAPTYEEIQRAYEEVGGSSAVALNSLLAPTYQDIQKSYDGVGSSTPVAPKSLFAPTYDEIARGYDGIRGTVEPGPAPVALEPLAAPDAPAPGFDWGDAGVGIGMGAGLAALLAAMAVALRNRRGRLGHA